MVSQPNIWRIPEALGNKPLFKKPKATASMASELISPDGNWNLNSPEQNFCGPDMRVVSCIPLGKLSKDFWAWSPNKHGNYSVRPAYRLLINESRLNSDRATSSCR